MTVAQLLPALAQALQERVYLRRMEIVEQSRSQLKARLYVAPNLYVQVYRNDLFDTTNFVLIHNDKRIFARDRLNSRWHRHPLGAPEFHDRSAEGQRAVDLPGFLDEVEAILTTLELP